MIPVILNISIAEDEQGKPKFSRLIWRDISDLKTTQVALLQAKEEAEAASVIKGQFLANMSHEIRTPMNAIISLTDLALQSQDKRKIIDHLEKISHSSHSLLSIINDILDLSKIEAGQLVLERIPMNLPHVVHETVTLFTFTALDKGITLSHHIDPALPEWVLGDPARLRQILLNLIGNAIKFTSKGSVNVAVRQEAGQVGSFAIMDTGCGIDKEKIEEIFQPFTQADASTTRQYGGTGLGLTICRRLTNLMEGHLALTSEPGRGSTFTLHLPLKPTKPNADIAEIAGEKRTTPLQKMQATISSQRPLNILLVDDAKDNRLLIQAFLKRRPYHLEMAVNGEEAVAKFKHSPFDLVLMDIQMPVMDGYEATRTIRAWEQTCNAKPTPIIALTAHAMAEESEQIRSAGCDLHLTKPIRKQFLLKVIDQTTQ
ncbi:MAG: response regulator [Magnetococcales bacterium]|nr:response regulator [Magnetococcales bacterium]